MTRRIRLSIGASLAALAMVSSACSVPAGGGATAIRVAFFQDLSVPDHVDLVSPSFLAFETVVQRRLDGAGASVEIVQFDTAGDADAAIEMAREVADDATFVLAVAAPFWHEPAGVGRILAEAGVPTISLSPVSASPWLGSPDLPGDARQLWRRFVPDRSAEAGLLATMAARGASTDRPVCLVQDGSAYGAGLIDLVRDALDGQSSTRVDGADPGGAASTIATAGCSVVVWGGFPPGARDLARSMREAGSARGRPLDLAGDALKTIVPPTSPQGDGVVVGSVACSCVDVATDLELPSRRFLNLYQSEHGLAPGVYAAEGWDAGRLAADAVRDGATDRTRMREAFAGLTEHEGVARTYVFDDDGDLVGGEPGLYVAAGTRWLSLPV
jgi:branched-chain amino acid transport system substrate-binding protein